MKNVVHVNGKSIIGTVGVGDGDVRSYVEGVVLRAVEDVLNALLEAESAAVRQNVTTGRGGTTGKAISGEQCVRLCGDGCAALGDHGQNGGIGQ